MNDPAVEKIFDAVAATDILPNEKPGALLRAARLAELYWKSDPAQAELIYDRLNPRVPEQVRT